jgi:hypothetical protein
MAQAVQAACDEGPHAGQPGRTTGLYGC